MRLLLRPSSRKGCHEVRGSHSIRCHFPALSGAVGMTAVSSISDLAVASPGPPIKSRGNAGTICPKAADRSIPSRTCTLHSSVDILPVAKAFAVTDTVAPCPVSEPHGQDPIQDEGRAVDGGLALADAGDGGRRPRGDARVPDHG